MGEYYTLYGAKWSITQTDLAREIDCIRNGGEWLSKGRKCGNGLFFHFQKAQQILWPEKKWHRWNELELRCFLDYKFIGEMGCASAGKTESMATNFLLDWYCFSSCTTVLVSSTTLPALNLRIFGTMKRYHKLARERYSWLPGHLIEGKQVILNDAKTEFAEGRDFRNGIIAVPCKKGDSFVGLGEYVGIHNKRVRLAADELQFLPRAFIDSISNLSKCPDFKCCGSGNPNETTNALGVLCEPEPELGGWDSGIDQSPKTKTWKTRFPGGIAIQLPGSDCPNMDDPPGSPPRFPFLITREQMEADAKIWGTDDWHYTMMNEARMPRGQGSRRVLTRQMCLKFHAMESPVWRDTVLTKIAFLDAAYRGTGGDRCVFGELNFGHQAESDLAASIVSNLISQNNQPLPLMTLLALVDHMIIPISMEKGQELPEDQIVKVVKAECERRGIPPENFFFDSGMRTSLVSAFARVWSPQVNPIDCGGKASERQVSGGIEVKCCDYYSKFITELWYSVRLTVEAGQFRGMTADMMYEGCSREWKTVSGNRIEVETKAEMKLKTGRSPDLFDGLAVGVEGARRRGFVIQSLRSELGYTDNSWKRQLREQAKAVKVAHELDYSL